MKQLLIATLMCLLLAVPAWAEEDCVCMEDTYRSMEVSNPDMKLSPMTGLTEDGAYMKIFGGLSVADTMRMWNDMIYLRDNTEIRDVHLFINSPGGSAFDGLAMSDWVSAAQDEWGFTLHATASGIIASAAVPIFVSCDKRKAMPGTIFMVHEAAIWKWPGRESASDIRSQNELMNLLKDKYFSIMIENTNLSHDKLEEMEKNTTWFGVDDAKDWGVVNE